MAFLPECRYKQPQGCHHVNLADQDDSKRGLLVEENVPGCSAGLSHMTREAAGSLLPGSSTNQLSFSDLGNARSSRGTSGFCQRSVRLQWLAELHEDLLPDLVEVSTVIRTSNYHQVYPRYKFSLTKRELRGQTRIQRCHVFLALTIRNSYASNPSMP